MSCTTPTPPFELALSLNSAPSWPFTLEPDEDADDFTLAGGAVWFAVKTLASDLDADAHIFASTANGKIAITDGAARQFQVDLLKADTQATASFVPGALYVAFLKIQLATGETREAAGWLTTLPSGIEAP